jgi:hypothetical protein
LARRYSRRRYRRRTTRLERQAYTALTVCALLAWAWQTHPVWTVLGVLVAVAGFAGRWQLRRKQRARGKQGWIYHLPPWTRSRLVYVGQTTWPERRMAQHQGLQGPPSWFAEHVDFSRVRWFGPFPAADLDQIEADHIHTYDPWANQLRCESLRRPALLRHKTARPIAAINHERTAA